MPPNNYREDREMIVFKDAADMARNLANEIRLQRNGLNNEDAQANGEQLRHYARAKKYREQDRAKVNGMVIALTFVLGVPNDMAAAEKFIAGFPFAPHYLCRECCGK